jgi:predicted transcriptional regulator
MYKKYTRGDYVAVARNWGTLTRKEIANSRGIQSQAVSYIVTRLKEAGLKMKRAKYEREGLTLAQQVVAELKAEIN